MKLLRIVAVLLIAAGAGCKQTPDAIVAVHASPVDNNVRYEFSGARIPYSAVNGQVHEYY